MATIFAIASGAVHFAIGVLGPGPRRINCHLAAQSGGAVLDFRVAAPHIAAMTALLFDTLRLSRTLRDKGILPPNRRKPCAMETANGKHQSEIAATMDVVKAELARMKADVLKWLFVALYVQAIILVSAFVWFDKRMFQ